MIDAAESIAGFVGGRDRSTLDADRMLLFAVVHALEVLGEAAGGSSTKLEPPRQTFPSRLLKNVIQASPMSFS
jgi:uncharacterized protein with HEPN domain